MKTLPNLLLLFMLGFILSGCRTDTQTEAPPLPESIKGYELYSWQEGNQWVFSLLAGTNREKTPDEIKSADTILSDLEALKSTLDKVPAGQYVTWVSSETFPFPPDKTVKQVEKICKDKGLILQLVK